MISDVKEVREVLPKSVCNAFWLNTVIDKPTVKSRAENNAKFDELNLIQITKNRIGANIVIYPPTNIVNKRISPTGSNGYGVDINNEGAGINFMKLEQAWDYIVQKIREIQVAEIKKCWILGFRPNKKVLNLYKNNPMIKELILKDIAQTRATRLYNLKNQL